MAQTYIGKAISLISHSDVRYRGILAGIDPEASTIQLSNVYSMGTESRRASEVKELAVDEQETPSEPKRNVYDDPAVMQSAPIVAPPAQTNDVAGAQPTAQQQFVPPAQQQQPYQNHHPRGDHRDGRGGHRGGGGGRRGGGGGRGGGQVNAQPITVPSDDFDFESANARFEKSAPPPPTNPAAVAEELEAGQIREDAASPQAYDKTKSFFDTLTPGPTPAAGAENGGVPTNGRGRGRGGRGRGRGRRDEEREKNLSTFGEAGGIGLMGPGAYVGGWGGYGRRGGGRRGGRGGQANPTRA